MKGREVKDRASLVMEGKRSSVGDSGPSPSRITR